MPIFLALAVAQILSDFPLQTGRMVKEKEEGARGTTRQDVWRYGGYIKHGSVLLGISILAVYPWWSPRVFLAVLIVTLAHVLLDYAKCRYVRHTTVSMLLGDQTLHLLVILVVLTALGLGELGSARDLVQSIWASYRDPTLIVSSGYLISIWVGGIVVRVFLDSMGSPGQIDEGLQNAGRRIGQLERFLVTTLTVLDQYSAIAFVFAAKSIARFKKIEESPTFAEYYLAGTLASVSLAVLVGLAIKGGLALVRGSP